MLYPRLHSAAATLNHNHGHCKACRLASHVESLVLSFCLSDFYSLISLSPPPPPPLRAHSFSLSQDILHKLRRVSLSVALRLSLPSRLCSLPGVSLFPCFPSLFFFFFRICAKSLLHLFFCCFFYLFFLWHPSLSPITSAFFPLPVLLSMHFG